MSTPTPPPAIPPPAEWPSPDNPTPPLPALPSPTGSMAGWSFLTWLRKNKGAVKQTVSIAGGLAVAWVLKFDPEGIGIGALAKIGLQLALDAVDFWLTADPQ